MIVYGDPAFEEALPALLTQLRQRLAALRRSSPAATSLDDLRALLIQAGQVEQAVEDGLPRLAPSAAPRLCSLFRTATDAAASAFRARWASEGAPAGIADALESMARGLDALGMPPGIRLSVKIPEGFAFYTLYPEQYAAAAARWMAEHADVIPRRAVVVGIRSIGTTLSAVVAAVLAAAGWQARRLTVRPAGPPYARQVDLEDSGTDSGRWGLIVDEGPGQSGSSMAAAAAALARAGIDRSRIGFLPSHGAGPGPAASAESRAWWSAAPCTTIPLADLRWEGRSLPELLAARAAALGQDGEPYDRTADAGGGLWRRLVYPDPNDWPAACAPFERTKYHCASRGGRSVFWKFAGLASVGSAGTGADQHLARLAARAEGGWTPAPLGAAGGFIALPWIDGAPLTPADADPAAVAHLGRHLVGVAGPPLSDDERSAAFDRLREMLYWNTWESEGEAAAARARHWADAAAELADSAPHASAGDGRLAPHEWRRTAAGRLLKLDCAGHDADHTIIGRQPLAWDIAGALVEWQLDPPAAALLLDAVRRAGGPPLTPAALAFYRMAYAAFRLGQCSLCAQMSAHDPAEQERLWRCVWQYQQELVWLLANQPYRSPGAPAGHSHRRRSQ